VFVIVLLGLLFGMAYAHVEGGTTAKRAASIIFLVYHLPSTAPLSSAAGVHVFYAAFVRAAVLDCHILCMTQSPPPHDELPAYSARFDL